MLKCYRVVIIITLWSWRSWKFILIFRPSKSIFAFAIDLYTIDNIDARRVKWGSKINCQFFVRNQRFFSGQWKIEPSRSSQIYRQITSMNLNETWNPIDINSSKIDSNTYNMTRKKKSWNDCINSRVPKSIENFKT